LDHQAQEYVDKYELAVAFAKQFEKELGQERALEIIGRAFEGIQVKAAKELAVKLGSNSFEAFADHNRRAASEMENLHIIEITDQRIATKFSRCLAWEAFKHLGAPELCKAYCDSDYAYIKAFNPNMHMVRTKTIADGDDYCDHTWVMGNHVYQRQLGGAT